MKQATRTYVPIAPIALMATTLAAPARATPIEGDFSVNAAALLFVLGVWALLMGLRNLRSLRYRPMIPQRRKDKTGRHTAEEAD